MSRELDGAFVFKKARVAPRRRRPARPYTSFGMALKRVADVVLASIGLVLLSPLFLFIAIRIKRDSPGPILYRGLRVGRDGKEFYILKFRTMYEEPESYGGPKVTAYDDPRITPVGRWLRYTKLNELPQLWNVLKGDMSLVGPRPEDPAIVAKWPEEIRREVLSVRPGVTSPASVLYRQEESMLDNSRVMETYLNSIAPDKWRLDQLYVRHMSIGLDLDTLLWTLLVLLPRLRGYQPSERRLFRGPVSQFLGRYLNWFMVDMIVSFCAIVLSAVLWRAFTPLYLGEFKLLAASVVFTLIYSVLGMLFGVQKIAWSRARGEDVTRLVPPTVLATALVMLLNELAASPPLLPRPLLLVAAMAAFLGFVGVRYRTRLLRGLSASFLRDRPAATLERVIIVGGGMAGQMAAWMLTHGDKTPFHVLGYVDDDLYKVGTRIAGLPVLGQRDDIPALVEEHDVGVVVFAIHNIDSQERERLLEQCTAAGAHVLIFPDFKRALQTTLDALHGAAEGRSGVSATILSSVPGIAPAQVQGWLQDLSVLMERGDAAAAQAQIRRLQEAINAFPADPTTNASTRDA